MSVCVCRHGPHNVRDGRVGGRLFVLMCGSVQGRGRVGASERASCDPPSIPSLSPFPFPLPSYGARFICICYRTFPDKMVPAPDGHFTDWHWRAYSRAGVHHRPRPHPRRTLLAGGSDLVLGEDEVVDKGVIFKLIAITRVFSLSYFSSMWWVLTHCAVCL